MDVVYLVRPGDDNDELRYSLRSLTNLPHDQVWVSGYRPYWVENVQVIKGNTHPMNSNANVYNNLLRAMECDEISDQVIVFNDDFYVTEPVTTIKPWYLATLAEHYNSPDTSCNPTRTQSLVKTEAVLRDWGVDEPLSFELHTPFVVDRERMRDILVRFSIHQPNNPLQARSLYGNLVDEYALQHDDVKAYGSGSLNRPFHSTFAGSFPYFRQDLDELFPDPSRYEYSRSMSMSR